MELAQAKLSDERVSASKRSATQASDFCSMLQPDRMSVSLLSTFFSLSLAAAIKIGRTMFETDRLPSGWSSRLNQLDWVWVPTRFHADVFAAGGVDASKLVVVPEPVDTEFYSPEHAATLEPFEYPGEADGVKPFRFLSIFKWEERKGWQVLLEAFLREFAQQTGDESEKQSATGQPVVLYILTSAYHSDSDFQSRIDSFVETMQWDGGRPRRLPPIRLLPSGVPLSRMPALYAGADAFVLPSRGEGWGRPHVEAMSMAKPLLATHWSGPSEYMRDDNSFPLRHSSLVEIESGAFKGHRWAQPSVEHLRELMRLVVSDPDAARLKGQQARRDMVERYCYACVAKLVVQELARIQAIQTKGAAEEEQATQDEL